MRARSIVAGASAAALPIAALLACGGNPFYEVQSGDASAPSNDAAADAGPRLDAPSPDAPLAPDAPRDAGSRDAAPGDAGCARCGECTPDAQDTCGSGGGGCGTGTRVCGADGVWGACTPPAGSCAQDAQAACTPACGQWAGAEACKADCSGFGACVTSPFTWSASAADGGFLHECAGTIDQYGNWQTNYTSTPNDCLAQYGPYLQVPRGAYQASVQVWGTADTVRVTVTNHSGANTLQSSSVESLASGWSTISVPPFRIDDDACTGVELRVDWVTAKGVAIVVGPSTLVRTGP